MSTVTRLSVHLLHGFHASTWIYQLNHDNNASINHYQLKGQFTKIKFFHIFILKLKWQNLYFNIFIITQEKNRPKWLFWDIVTWRPDLLQEKGFYQTFTFVDNIPFCVWKCILHLFNITLWWKIVNDFFKLSKKKEYV